jgi:hypothetical protein
MRYLKNKNISKYSISDDTLFVNQFGRVVIDSPSGIRLPKGTTAQRPQLTGVDMSRGANGMIRYNTTTDSIEAYVAGVWEVVRAPGATAITKQTLGPGNDLETTFGPLTLEPSSENNIIVLVENVMQISDTNYNLVYNYLGVQGDTRIVFTSPVPTDKYITIFYGYSN